MTGSTQVITGVADPSEAGNPISRSLDTTANVISVNRRRLILLMVILGSVVLAVGAAGVIAGAGGVVGSLPTLAVQLTFAAFYLVLQFGVLMWFLSRPRKYTVTPDDAQIAMRFDNYRGQPDLLDHAKSTVRILQGAKEFEHRGGEMPKGLLLSGRPGTGKTFLAACIASEANLPFIYIDASSIRGMFMGMTEMMVMKLFRDARSLARKYAEKGKRGVCIVFMDEINSIGMARGGQQGNMGMGMGMMGMMAGSNGLNTLLNQMDSLGDFVEDRWSHKMLRWVGLERGPVRNKPLIFVIGATNRPSVLDPALTRPGRLDRILEVHVPDAEGRLDIIEHYLAPKAHQRDIPVEVMVADSIGWTPIQIKTVINEALIKAHDEGRAFLTYRDWVAASDERDMGLKQPIRNLSLEDKRLTAYHEAGHAVVAHYLKPEDRIQKATIQRQGHALGFIRPMPREERQHLHSRQIEIDIMISLGARAAEEMYLDTKMTGARSDLSRATNSALAYCALFGMGSTLLVVPDGGMTNYPPPVVRMADALLENLMAETKRLLTEKEYAVHALAAALIQREELLSDELDEVFGLADATNPHRAGPFERKLVTLPKLFQDPSQASGGTWPVQDSEGAAAVGAMWGEPSGPRQPRNWSPEQG